MSIVPRTLVAAWSVVGVSAFGARALQTTVHHRARPFWGPTRRPAGLAVVVPAMATAAGTKRVLVPVADGSEEIESVTIMDTLVRAGADVTVASVGSAPQVTCSRGVKLVADCLVGECTAKEWDAIVCPGGMPGATNLKENESLEMMLKKQHAEGRLVAAICAAPAMVLAPHGILDGKEATCYPTDAFKGALSKHTTMPVVVDGNVVTSQGPGTALAFSLKLVEEMYGADKAAALKQEMLFPG